MYYAVKKIRASSIFALTMSSTTCSRNPCSWSTPDLHTARPPNNFRPQHKTQNDRRTKHPEFRNSGRVFETLHIWNVLVNDKSGSIWDLLNNTNSLQYFCKSPHFDNPGWTHTQHPSQGNLLHILRKQILLWAKHILNALTMLTWQWTGHVFVKVDSESCRHGETLSNIFYQKCKQTCKDDSV